MKVLKYFIIIMLLFSLGCSTLSALDDKNSKGFYVWKLDWVTLDNKDKDDLLRNPAYSEGVYEWKDGKWVKIK